MTWGQVDAELHAAASKFVILPINGFAKEALDYKEHEAEGRNVTGGGGDKRCMAHTIRSPTNRLSPPGCLGAGNARSIIGLDVAHFPERGAEPEVDFVLSIGEQRIPIEVKFRRRIDFHDTYGLPPFIEKAHYHAPFGILVTQLDEAPIQDPRIVCLPLSSFLLLR